MRSAKISGRQVHQVRHVVAVATVAAPVDLARHDVVAALDHAPQVRELRLHGLALGPQRPQLGDGPIRQAGEVVVSRIRSSSVSMAPPGSAAGRCDRLYCGGLGRWSGNGRGTGR